MTGLPYGGDIELPSAEHSVGKAWIVTFADLMAIILSFFIMIFSMSSIQTKAWLAVVAGLSDELSPGREQAILGTAENARPLRVLDPKGIDLGYLVSVVKNKFQANPILQNARIEEKLDRVSITLPLDLLFESATATPKVQAGAIASIVGGSLNSIKNRIEIHAYAPGPSRARRGEEIAADDPFDSGWELAIAQSAIMSRMLHDAGLPRAPLAVGHITGPAGLSRPAIELVVREMGAE